MNKTIPLSDLELAAFCSSLAMLLNSGISAEDGLAVMYEDVNDKQSKQILADITESLHMGEGLVGGLNKAAVFPPYMVDIIGVGEVSGSLDRVLASLSRYYENEHEIKENLKSAVKYPAFMCLMMAVVIGVLVGKVLPVFAGVYASLGSQLSGVSQSIMALGGMFSKYSVVFIAILIAVMSFYAYCTYTDKGKDLGRKFLKKFFATKGIYEKTSQARFAFGLSLMLSSGFDTSQSMERVLGLIEDEGIRAKVQNCSKIMAEGQTFETAAKQTALFSPSYTRMITIGFKTGNYERVMEKISDDYSARATDEINSKISMIEPAMVAVFSIIVGLILLSVILPLMGVMSVMG